MSLPVAILAGGLATRLRPTTERMPKALIELRGEPFIAHQLKLLKRHNIERVVLCVGFLGEMIRAAIGNGHQFGLNVNYSFDGPTLLGTGGALKKAVPLLGDVFFVLYGDSYLDCDYQAVQVAFERSGLSALMTIYRNEGRWEKSNVLFIDDTIVKYDKKNPTPGMRHLDYGLGVFKSSVFEVVLPEQAFDLSDIYTDLAAHGELAGYEISQRFYEIGSQKGLQEMKKYLSRLDNSERD